MIERLFGARSAPDGQGDTDASAEDTDLSRRRRIIRRVALIALSVVGGLIFLYAGFNLFLQLSEWRDPSGRVYVKIGGEQVYLEQPTAIVTPPGLPTVGGSTAATPTPTATQTSQPSAAADAADDDDSDDPDPTPRPDVPLPPLRIEIDAIAVDVPVYLVTNDDLPRQPFAGWFFRSAFPATAGNTVIVGHLDGRAAVFGRLHELAVGDQLRVYTQDKVHVYVVDSSASVGPEAVEVLAPTDEAVLTLITCSGDWNPVERSYDRRLVVRAHYAAVEDLPAS